MESKKSLSGNWQKKKKSGEGGLIPGRGFTTSGLGAGKLMECLGKRERLGNPRC